MTEDSAPLSGPAADPAAVDVDDDQLQAFIVPPMDGEAGPAAYYRNLVADDRFEHLREGEAEVAFLYRSEVKTKQGRHIIGTCYMPSVQGELKPLFDWLLQAKLGYTPDFLIIIERDWWLAATPRLREILIFHEMQHAGQAVDQYGTPKFSRETGRPVWTIIGHDVEEFQATVERYGAWNDELMLFKRALNTPPREEPLF